MRPFRFFGVAASGPVGLREITETARRAESSGFTGLVLPDHLIEQHAPIPALTAVAAVTERLRVLPFVLNTGLRHPAVIAQDLASLDVLSGGRLEIGLGAGWNKVEHDVTGIPFDPVGQRVARLAEVVDVIKGCFAPGPFSYSGRFFTIDGYDAKPKPVQQPHPPLFLGGGGRRVLTLAAEHADTIGLAPRLITGADGNFAVDPDSYTLDGTREKIAWVRQAAGERFDSLEFNAYPSGGPLLVTDDAVAAAQEQAERMREKTGRELTATEILDSPHVYIGTVEQLVEKIRSLRAELGISSFMLGDVETAAPIVERLAGQ